MDDKMKFSTPIDIEFDWHLTNACNFNCEYCFPAIKAKKNTPFSRDFTTKKIVDAFNSTGKVANINMSGGEPFLFPNFVSLCVGLTQKHHIGINSNLSVPIVTEFAEKIDPRKVSYIWAALHLDERSKLSNGLETYVKHFNLLKEKGFNIFSLYVLHPSKLDVYEDQLNVVRAMGVKDIKIKPFKGVYEGAEYPESYPNDIKEKLILDSGGYKPVKEYMNGDRNFCGKRCNAGISFFKVWEDGSVQRCASDNTNYGNLYDGKITPDAKPLKCKITKVLTLSQCQRFVIDK